MNERYMPNELTGGSASSKLNITHPNGRGRFVMDEGIIEKSPRINIPTTPEERADYFIKQNQPPLTLEDLIASKIPQERRETARVAWDEWAKMRGRPLSDQEKEYQRIGLLPIGGGADGDATGDGGGVPMAPRERPLGQPEHISTAGVTHPELLQILRDINSKRLNEESISGAIDAINGLQLADVETPIPESEMREVAGRVNDLARAFSAKSERLGFYLQDDDREQIMEDSQKWLDSKFDLVYLAASSGQELESQVLQGVQSLVGEANQFLSRRFQQAFDQGNVTERERYRVALDLFNRRWAVRKNLLVTRFQVDRRGIDEIVGSFGSLRAEGLVGALSFDDSRTGAMFNRMNELLEDIRLSKGGDEKHLTPQMVAGLQGSLEEEQFKLAKAGVGAFATEYKRVQAIASSTGKVDAEDKLRSEIRRSVRTAYDVFISSQREAIISAKGRHLSGTDAFFSDTGGAFNIFNLEDLLIGKYGLLTVDQNKMLDRIKLDMVDHESSAADKKGLTDEEKLEHGRRLFRDLFAVPDFFSSGWRIKGMLQQIEAVTKYNLQNEKIVEMFLAGGGSETQRTKYKKFLDSRMGMSDWGVLVASMDGDEQRMIKKTTQEFAKGMTNSAGETGLTEGERRELVRTLRLDSREIDRQAKAKARNLGLFLRLKKPEVSQEVLSEGDTDGVYADKETREAVWKRIQHFRPEDIVRIVRERSDLPRKKGEKQSEYDKLMLKKVNRIFSSHGVGTEKNGYDAFKKDYAAVIKSLREEAFAEQGKQLDLRNLNASQTEKINKALNAIKGTEGVNYASKVTSIYADMHGFINEGDIIQQLLTSSKYEDIYGKTIAVDDALLDQLEYVPENSGITRLSQRWSTEGGADGLQRNGNDLKAAVAAGKALVEFLKAESKDEWRKAATGFAHHAGDYNGLKGGVAKCFRYTYGTYLLTAEQDYLADLAGVGKLPFRLNSSDIERIFGKGVDPLTREQILKELDQVSGLLTGEPDPGGNPHHYYEQLMHLLGTDTFSRTRDKLLQLSIFTLLILMLAPIAGAVKAVGVASK